MASSTPACYLNGAWPLVIQKLDGSALSIQFHTPLYCRFACSSVQSYKKILDKYHTCSSTVIYVNIVSIIPSVAKGYCWFILMKTRELISINQIVHYLVNDYERFKHVQVQNGCYHFDLAASYTDLLLHLQKYDCLQISMAAENQAQVLILLIYMAIFSITLTLL